jgi:excisionase family DNA binding protein
MNPQPECLTYTIEEAAMLLGIGRNQAYEAARRGEIPTIRFGKRLVVPRAALTKLLDGNPETVALRHRRG